MPEARKYVSAKKVRCEVCPIYCARLSETYVIIFDLCRNCHGVVSNRNVRDLVQTGHMLFHSWLRRSGVVVEIDYFVIVVVFCLFVCLFLFFEEEEERWDSSVGR